MLSATAIQISNDIQHINEVQKLNEMMEELLSLPSRQAADTWWLLASKSGLWESGVAWDLRDNPSVEGADILNRITNDSKADEETRAEASQSLDLMYNIADPKVKLYIYKINLDRGRVLPDIIPIHPPLN